jgi:predicted ATPase
MLGRPAEALKLSDEAVWRARQLKHRFSLALTLLTSAALRFYRREPEAAYTAAEALVAVAEEQGFREMMAFGRSLRGWVRAELGHIDEGIAELEANAALLPAGLQMMVSGIIAQVHIDTGGFVRALEIVDETLARIKRSGAHVDEPELRRLKGEALLTCDASMGAEAEAWFRDALAIAQQRSAKWWELRASVSLARLLRDTNRCDEARTIVGGIYNWFTDGFELPDLQEAKALLDELSGTLQ